MTSVIEDVLAVAAGLARPGTVTGCHVPVDMPAPAAPEALFRILMNLAVNAVAAVNRGGGGEVRLDARRCGRVVLIDVVDTGPGFAAGAAAPAAAAGSGLGLTIARALSAEIGGRLALLHTGPQGTTFRLRLPAACAQGPRG